MGGVGGASVGCKEWVLKSLCCRYSLAWVIDEQLLNEIEELFVFRVS